MVGLGVVLTVVGGVVLGVVLTVVRGVVLGVVLTVVHGVVLGVVLAVVRGVVLGVVLAVVVLGVVSGVVGFVLSHNQIPTIFTLSGGFLRQKFAHFRAENEIYSSPGKDLLKSGSSVTLQFESQM